MERIYRHDEVMETNGEFWLAFPLAVMLFVYFVSSNAAFILMLCSKVHDAREANGNDKAAGVEETESLVVSSDVERTQPRSGVIWCASLLLYVIGILFDLFHISFTSEAPLHGIVIFVLVSFNAIPWLLIETTGKLFKSNNRISRCLSTCM